MESYPTAIFFLVGFAIFSIFYVFSSFFYEISENKIKIRWKVFKCIPFNSIAININRIQAIRLFNFERDIISGWAVWGNLFIRRGVILELKKGIFKKYYITPKYPEKFIKDVKSRMAASGGDGGI